MTIQRALRDLQQMRITYSVAGKCTFIHPDFVDLRADAPFTPSARRHGHPAEVGEYLEQERAILASHGTTGRDKTAATRVPIREHHNRARLRPKIEHWLKTSYKKHQVRPASPRRRAVTIASPATVPSACGDRHRTATRYATGPKVT